MVFITLHEIFDILLMTFVIGFIFSSFIRPKPRDILDYYKSNMWNDIKYGIIIAAPAVVLHELSHKFMAMSFGATATLHAPYSMYAIVILMKLVNFPLMFFVGGYVSHTALPALQSSFVALAGPLINLLIWLVILLLVKTSSVNKKYYNILVPAAKLNMFLFIFNMIPIPGFDGFGFLQGLFQAFVR